MEDRSVLIRPANLQGTGVEATEEDHLEEDGDFTVVVEDAVVETEAMVEAADLIAGVAVMVAAADPEIIMEVAGVKEGMVTDQAAPTETDMTAMLHTTKTPDSRSSFQWLYL